MNRPSSKCQPFSRWFFTWLLIGFSLALPGWRLPAAAAEANPNSLPQETPAQKAARLKWWTEARFGIFIHWGIYSIPAGEWDGYTNYAEWFLEQTHMPVSQYEKYADQFNPVKFNARAWVQAARNAGAKYIVITSKHHDGFGMYPSQLTDWCLRRTPCKRDPLKELAAACQAQDIHFCLYYSIMDWHHPDWGQRRPWNDLAARDGPPDMNRYVAYMKGQLKELLSNYGPIGLLWFDGQWESCWTTQRGDDLYHYVRRLQPDIIVNNRVSKPANTAGGGFARAEGVGDYGTPEQTIPPAGFGPGVYWESCMTMNDHWGYNKHDHDWKSAQTLVRNLIDCASKGGNYLLNIGPTSEGVIPAASLERLQKIGMWMKVNHEAIYGTEAGPFTRQLPWGRCTSKAEADGTTLYLHVFDWPTNGHLFVPQLQNRIQRAYLLADTSRKNLATENRKHGVRVKLPIHAATPCSTTVVLEMTGQPELEPRPHIEASASNVFQHQQPDYGPQFAFDGNAGTRWATDDGLKQAWIVARFVQPQTLQAVHINEAYAGRVQQFEFQYRDQEQWKTIFSGTTLGSAFEQHFSPVTSREFRLNILAATQGPTLNEIEFIPAE